MIPGKPFIACGAILAWMAVSGCRSFNKVMLDRAIIINATQDELIDVNITHQPSQITGSASLILPGKTFDLGFSKRPLLADRAIVEWTQRGTGTYRAELPLRFEPYRESTPAMLIYTIEERGRANVTLSTDRSLP